MSNIICTVTPENETAAEELARTRKLAYLMGRQLGRTQEQTEQVLKEAFGQNYTPPEEASPEAAERAQVFLAGEEGN